MKALWTKIKGLGAGAWAAIGAFALLVAAVLGDRFAQDRLREKRKAQDARVLAELEREAAAAKERGARRARLLELERDATEKAEARKLLETEARTLEEQIRDISDDELEARWRAFVAGKGDA